jgi:hypothetical protein
MLPTVPQSTSNLAQPEQRGVMNSSISVSSPQAPFQMVVLLVEPDHDVLENRALLLSRSSYMVATATSQRTVFDLRWMTGIYLAILSDTLGLTGLRSAAGYIRALWPSARIVVLGIAPSALEVHLYDEAVDHPVQPEKLLDTLARLSEDPWNQRQRVISCDLGASRCLDKWLTVHRSKLAESGPTKITHPWEKNSPKEYSSGQTVRHKVAQGYGARQDKFLLLG